LEHIGFQLLQILNIQSIKHVCLPQKMQTGTATPAIRRSRRQKYIQNLPATAVQQQHHQAPKLGPAGCAYAAVSHKAHDRISCQKLLQNYFAADAGRNSAQQAEQCCVTNSQLVMPAMHIT